MAMMGKHSAFNEKAACEGIAVEEKAMREGAAVKEKAMNEDCGLREIKRFHEMPDASKGQG